MDYLRKTILAFVLLVVIHLLKKALLYLFPVSAVFHYNLLSFLQITVLLLLVIYFLFGALRRKHTFHRYAFFLFLLIIAIPESLCAYWLHHPSSIPHSLLPYFRSYYGNTQRNIIQFNPNSAVYNSRLFYTLKTSSKFTFENYEFSDSFFTNSAGLRDDESSLQHPGIICLGDSYAMGWGVSQQETFPELLAKDLGASVLNAGISSYGTARELTNLYRLDTTNLNVLIIQFSRNDAIENAAFINDRYHLMLSSETAFNETVSSHYWNKLWFPGKHTMTISKMMAAKQLAGFRGRSSRGPSAIDSLQSPIIIAAHFVDLLSHSAINFNKTKVFVVDVNAYPLMNDDFINEVKRLASTPPFLDRFAGHLTVVPVAGLLSKDDYYILDDHLRASGHKKIAGALLHLLRSK